MGAGTTTADGVVLAGRRLALQDVTRGTALGQRDGRFLIGLGRGDGRQRRDHQRMAGALHHATPATQMRLQFHPPRRKPAEPLGGDDPRALREIRHKTRHHATTLQVPAQQHDVCLGGQCAREGQADGLPLAFGQADGAAVGEPQHRLTRESRVRRGGTLHRKLDRRADQTAGPASRTLCRRDQAVLSFGQLAGVPRCGAAGGRIFKADASAVGGADLRHATGADELKHHRHGLVVARRTQHDRPFHHLTRRDSGDGHRLRVRRRGRSQPDTQQ